MQVNSSAAAAAGAGAQANQTIDTLTQQMATLSVHPTDFRERLMSTYPCPSPEETRGWTASWITDPRPTFHALRNALSGSSLNALEIIALAVEYAQGSEEDNVFGARKWEAIGCRVDRPFLPAVPFEGIWQGECPGYPGRKVHQICLLIFMPEKVNGKPLSPVEMMHVAGKMPPHRPQLPPHCEHDSTAPLPLHQAQYDQSTIRNGRISREEFKVSQPHWALLPTLTLGDALEIKERERSIPQGWLKPRVIDLVVANFMERMWNERYLHDIYVRSSEQIDGFAMHVGGHYRAGLSASIETDDSCPGFCVVGIRKFPAYIAQSAQLEEVPAPAADAAEAKADA